MGEAGILTRDDRVELIHGEIVEMSPIGNRHAACVGRLTHLLVPAVGAHAIVWVQNPILAGVESEPQPDVVLLRPRPDFYGQGRARPGDVLLLIEVSDTTLGYDRQVKLPLYAAAGIPESWIANLVEDCIEVCRTPAPDGYRDAQRVGRGGSVTPLAFPDVALAVGDILG